MKNVINAALLLSVTLIFSQASLAGGNGKGPDKEVPPPKETCPLAAAATLCADELAQAYYMLKTNSDAFKSERDFSALTCKVTAADLKIADGKPADAERKLSDSKTKIETLFSQGKLNVDYQVMLDMADAMEDARACAEGLIQPTY